MLQNRLKAFMITTQAISFATETIVPWLTRRAKVQAVKIQKEVAEKLHRNTHEDGSLTVLEDSEDAKKFLKRVQKQADLPEYDVNEDYAEMVLQVRKTSFVTEWLRTSCDFAPTHPLLTIHSLLFPVWICVVVQCYLAIDGFVRVHQQLGRVEIRCCEDQLQRPSSHPFPH
jgi:hypothetical protein